MDEWQKASTIDGLVPPHAAHFIRPEFQIGPTVKQALMAFKACWGLTLLTSLLSPLLAFASSLAIYAVRPDNGTLSIVAFGLGAEFCAMCIAVLGQAVVSYAAFQSLSGGDVGPARIIYQILRRAGPLAALCLVQVFIIVALAMVVFIVLGPLIMYFGRQFPFLILLTPIIYLVLLAFVQTSIYVAVPVCIISGQGPIACMTRSASLTENRRWRIFAIVFLSAVPLVPLVFIPSYFFPTAMFYAARYLPMPGLLSSSLPVLGLFFCFNLVGFLTTATYVNLCSAKEGTMDNNFAHVFD